MLAAILGPPGGRWSTTEPDRTCPGASPRPCSTRGGDEGPVRGGRGLAAAVAADLEPRLIVLGEPLPRPARPLRRARAARRQLGRAGRRAGPAAPRFALNADDPLVADLGRERELRGRCRLLRGGGRFPGAARASARRRLEALPQLRRAYDYDAVYLGHLGRYRCPNCGAERPDARGRRHAGRAATGCPARAWRPDTGGRLELRAPAARPLQRLQRAGGARPARSSSASPLEQVARGLEGFAAPSAGSETIPVGGARCRSCWSRTRPARTRCCAR